MLDNIKLQSVVVALLEKVKDATGSRILGSIDGDNADLASSIVYSASKERDSAP